MPQFLPNALGQSLFATSVFVLLTWPANADSVIIGERPAVAEHVDQAKIDSGQLSLHELIELGRGLFEARFNLLDGQGRPGSTGTGAPREPVQPAFVRTSAPDSNSCAGCHNQPASGGAGDIVANVFVLAQALDPVTFSVGSDMSNERNTPGMHGSSLIEMLAREMSAELISIREAARADAVGSGKPRTRNLQAKGVSFGRITVLPDGRVDPTEIEGVDWDLIIKPFHQKGAVVSLRERRRAALRGASLFSEIGCDRCHLKSLVLNARNFAEPNPYNPSGNLQPADLEQPLESTCLPPARAISSRHFPEGDSSCEPLLI